VRIAQHSCVRQVHGVFAAGATAQAFSDRPILDATS